MIKGRFHKLVFSLTTAASLSLSSMAVSANTENVSPRVNALSIYNDYEEGQYWSQDMDWAIENQLIQGYIQTQHPSGRIGFGNWLDPYGELKEAQMLTVLLRYFKAEELSNTKPADPAFWASTSYQLAEKYKLPTVSNLADRRAAFAVTTRGVLAQNLASLHFGQKVTMKQAVQFMYDSNISTGLPDANNQYAKTYASFGVNQPLKRSHIVSFMKRYDDFSKSGKDVVLQPASRDLEIAPKENHVLYHGEIKNIKLTVWYGKHDYGSYTQEKYDQVMEIVTNAIISDNYFPFKKEWASYYSEYFQGARDSIIFDRRDPLYRSERNYALLSIEKDLGKFIDAGASKEEIEKIYRLSNVAKNLVIGDKTGFSKPVSAYGLLVENVVNSVSIAEVYSAVFDAVGYNTMILSEINPAFLRGDDEVSESYFFGSELNSGIPAFELNGQWFSARDLYPIDLQSLWSEYYRPYVQPTKGGLLNSDGTIIRKDSLF